MKRLYKNTQDKIICGVCQGLSEYINIDVTVIRLLCILLGFTGTGILAYIIAAVIMPDKFE